jgi:hypothetical protein
MHNYSSILCRPDIHLKHGPEAPANVRRRGRVGHGFESSAAPAHYGPRSGKISLCQWPHDAIGRSRTPILAISPAPIRQIPAEITDHHIRARANQFPGVVSRAEALPWTTISGEGAVPPWHRNYFCWSLLEAVDWALSWGERGCSGRNNHRNLSFQYARLSHSLPLAKQNKPYASSMSPAARYSSASCTALCASWAAIPRSVVLP